MPKESSITCRKQRLKRSVGFCIRRRRNRQNSREFKNLEFCGRREFNPHLQLALGRFTPNTRRSFDASARRKRAARRPHTRC